MRQLIAILSLGLLLAPAVASAQAAPPGAGPSAPSAQMRAAMQQARLQMEQIHTQARNQMLGSLSPAHRTAVANVIGQLAVSPNPNPAVAARQIDAILTQAEGQSILRTHVAAKTQMQTLRTQMRSQYENSLTPDQRAQMEARRAEFAQQHPGGAQAHSAGLSSTDPGTILLRALGPAGGHEHGMHGGPGGPPPGA